MPSITWNNWKEHARYRGRFIQLDAESTPVTVDLDPAAMTKAIAEAMTAVLREAIANIRERASAATLRRRRRAGIASTTLFNATGRLARELAAVLRGKDWSIEPPDDHFGSEYDAGAAVAVIKRLRSLLPSVAELAESPGVVRAAMEMLERFVTPAK